MSAEHFLPVADQKNNIIRLSAAQALAGANSVVFYATGAIVGNALAPSSSLATLPITMFVLGMAACILPLGSLARTNGRKAAFMVGTGAGVITGLTAALAVFIGSFLLFCIAAFMGGAYAAVALSFRFAATDGVTPERRARALSLVMGGGVIAGVVGPMLVSGTMHLWPPHTFAVTFLAQAFVAVISAFILKGVKTTEPASAVKTGGRPFARDCPTARVCQNSIQRCGNLYGDELPDDGSTTLDAHARHFSAGVQSRYPVACYRHVRSGLFHRQIN